MRQKKTKCVKRIPNASKIDKCIKRTNCTKKTKLIKTKCIKRQNASEFRKRETA